LIIPAVKVNYSLDIDCSTSNNFILSPSDDRDVGVWLGDIDDRPWSSRGWTFQGMWLQIKTSLSLKSKADHVLNLAKERSLSTRLLYFCSRKLYFECRGCTQSEESEPIKFREHELWPRNEDWMKSAIDSTSQQAASPFKIKMYKFWTDAVTKYTRRQLTKEFDKLPAIQSIAAEMSTTIEDTYVAFAGMWKGNLKRDLLWQVRDGPTSISAKYRAPSWSWASLDAKIYWHQGFGDLKLSQSTVSPAPFDVLDIADIDVTTGESHALKIKARIKLLAFIMETYHDERWVKGVRITFPYDLFIPTSKLAQHGQHMPSPSKLTIGEKDTAVEQGYFSKFAEGRLDLDDRDGLTGSQRSLVYLHVDHLSSPSGLILESIDNRKDTWKRVGIATVFLFDPYVTGLLFGPGFTGNEVPVEIAIV
jgi:hypothetical protein